MRIRDARLRKVHVEGNGAQRNQNTDQTKDGVRHRTEHGKTKCGTVAHQWEVALHRHVMIEPNGGDGNQREDCGCDTCSDHPGWERSIDEALHPGPTGKQRVAPEADSRQMITVHRTTDYLGNHVIGSAETNRAEP